MLGSSEHLDGNRPHFNSVYGGNAFQFVTNIRIIVGKLIFSLYVFTTAKDAFNSCHWGMVDAIAALWDLQVME